MASRTIDLNGSALNKELNAAGAITPGHLLVRDGSGTVVVHATAGGRAQAMFARENDLQGDDITVAYASGDLVQMLFFPKGGEVNALVAAAAPAIVVGDFLESAGDGTLRVPVDVADLTGTLTGTVDGALTDITFNATWSQAQADEINKNFKEFQTIVNAFLPEVGQFPVAVALESVDNSGGGSAVRIRAEIL